MKSRATATRTTESNISYTTLASPIGELLLVADGQGLREIRLPGAEPHRPAPGWQRSEVALAEPIRQLREYFAGERREFRLRLAPEGTEFQRQVWRALEAVPYGVTVSYGDIAKRVGRPGAARAVGAANGANPLPIVVPCHRVIGADGTLTGFGGGLEMKEALLEHERAAAAAR